MDLSVPRMFAAYDKSGAERIVSFIKYHLFGRSNYRMTKRRCHEFFDDDKNFVLADAKRDSKRAPEKSNQEDETVACGCLVG